MLDTDITLEQAYAVIDAHRAREQAEKAERNRALIGRCFRFHNSSGDDERWWLYALVTGVNEFGEPTALTVQHTAGDTIEIENRGWFHVDHWGEISVAEFWAAAGDIRDEAIRRLTRP